MREERETPAVFLTARARKHRPKLGKYGLSNDRAARGKTKEREKKPGGQTVRWKYSRAARLREESIAYKTTTTTTMTTTTISSFSRARRRRVRRLMIQRVCLISTRFVWISTFLFDLNAASAHDPRADFVSPLRIVVVQPRPHTQHSPRREE